MLNTNIRALAKELKLSIGTISKSMRDSHEISESTKQRVREAALRLNYVANPYASSLRKKRSKTIAVVLPEVADSFFSLAINGIESVALEKGYHVLIYLTHENFEREETIMEEFRSGRVDGILISVSAETKNSDHIKKAMAANLPVVFFDRICEDINTLSVVTDDYESGYAATQHLIEKGCTRIAYLSSSPSLSISVKRMNGYLQALQDNNIKLIQTNILHCGKDANINYELIRRMITKQRSRPDGIVASVEKLSELVYRACAETAIQIPTDIKLICFTSLPTADILNPPLTTITQPAFEMGLKAATVLFKMLNKKNVPIKKEYITIPSVLRIRQSC